MRVTPPLGTRGPAYGGEYYTPYSTRKRDLYQCQKRPISVLYAHSPFGLVARVSATHKRDQTVAGPPQSPTRSLEGSGSQTDPPPPRAGTIAFLYSPDPSHVGWDTENAIGPFTPLLLLGGLAPLRQPHATLARRKKIPGEVQQTF